DCNGLDFIERNLILAPVVELPRPQRLVVGDVLRDFQLAGPARDREFPPHAAPAPHAERQQSTQKSESGSAPRSGSGSGARSFPRKRESTPQAFGNVLSSDWIPAFAGMTGAFAGMTCGSSGSPFQMKLIPC